MTPALRFPGAALAGGAADTAQEAAFRSRAAAWLAANAAERGSPWHPPAGAAARIERARQFQESLFGAGFAGLSLPREAGGQGLGIAEELIWAQESGRYDLPGLLMLGLHLCAPTLAALGSQEQKRELIPRILSGKDLWCQLFSEPGAGSDLGGVTTRARLDGDEWVVSGQKVWTSFAQFADCGMLIARTGTQQSRHKGLTMFALGMRTPGVTVRPLAQITGEPEFSEVFFDDVRIPARNVIGTAGGGWRAVLTMLMNERVALSGSDGAARADLDDAAGLIRSRGLAADPVVRGRFARLYLDSMVIELLSARVQAQLRSGDTPGPEGSIGKLALSVLLRQRADLMFEVAGDEAAAWRHGDPSGDRWAQALLFAPALSIGGGTDQIQKNVLGERILGLPREPAAGTREPS